MKKFGYVVIGTFFLYTGLYADIFPGNNVDSLGTANIFTSITNNIDSTNTATITIYSPNGYLTNDSPNKIDNNVGGIINNYSFLKNDSTINSSGTINNNATLNNTYYIYNHGTLTNNGGTIDNYVLYNFIGAALNNKLGGILNNNNYIRNDSGATLNNDGGTIHNYILYNHGTLNNNDGGIINNSNYLFNYSTLNNDDSTINNTLYLRNRIGGTLNNNDGGIINNNVNSSLYNYATLNNNDGGVINNSNYLYNYASATLNNDGGTINNNYQLTNKSGATLNNNGGIINNETYLSNSGELNNDGGTINNNQYLYNNSGATLNNNSGGIINNYSGAILYNNSGATLNNNSGGIINIKGGTFELRNLSTFTNAGNLNLSDGQILLKEAVNVEINDKVSVTGGTFSLDPTAQLSVKDRTTNLTIPNPVIDSGAGGDPSIGGLSFTTGNTAIVTLTGDNTFTGKTTVNSGTLYVNGSLLTPVDVNGPTAVFGGTDTVVKFDPLIPNSGNLTVTNGTLVPGGSDLFGQLTVEKQLVLLGASTVRYSDIDSDSNTNFIKVLETAALDGVLEVSNTQGNFLKGLVIPILDADGGIGGVFSSTQFPLTTNGLPVFEVQYTTNSVSLLVINSSLFSGKTIDPGNPTAVADNLIANANSIDLNSDLGFAINVLGLLSDDQLNRALNLMHPAAYGTIAWMNMNNNAHAMNIFSQRKTRRGLSRSNSSQIALNTLSAISEKSLVAGTLSGASFTNNDLLNNRQCKKNNVWVQPYGNLNYQGKLEQLRAVNSQSIGVATGYDRSFCNSFLGLGGGYTYTDFKWKDGAGDGHVNQGYGALYGNYWWNCFTLDFCTLVGGNFYDVDRNIEFGSSSDPMSVVSEVAHGDYTGIQWSSHLGVIGDFKLKRCPLQFLGNLDYFLLYQDSFNETGAGGLNLKVDSSLTNMLRTELGARTIKTFYYCGACCGYYVGASWVSKIPLGSTSISSTFQGLGIPFTVNTTTQWINQVVPSVGFEVSLKNGFSFGFDTYAELNGVIQTYYFDLNLEYAF